MECCARPKACDILCNFIADALDKRLWHFEGNHIVINSNSLSHISANLETKTKHIHTANDLEIFYYRMHQGVQHKTCIECVVWHTIFKCTPRATKTRPEKKTRNKTV